MIETGIAKETAGSGKPMSNIHGGAEIMASLANLGGGSKESGGGGVQA